MLYSRHLFNIPANSRQLFIFNHLQNIKTLIRNNINIYYVGVEVLFQLNHRKFLNSFILLFFKSRQNFITEYFNARLNI